MVVTSKGEEFRYELQIVWMKPNSNKIQEHLVSHIPLFEDEEALIKWAKQNIGELKRC